MKRRNFIGNIAALSAAASLPLPTSAASKKKKVFTVGWISDVHVKPTETAENGMRKALKHVNSLKPDFMINGGDSIMDAMAADKAKTQAQWDVWHRVMNEENKLPVYHCIGNHDAWGWQVNDPVVKTDPLYDKAWVVKEHGMSHRYYSFTKDMWHFIVLDSAQENNGGYIARIDEEQFAWLEKELKQTPGDKFICIVSHIPIVSFCAAMFIEHNEPNGDWRISRALLHVDNRRIKALFKQYPNIKVGLSGHIHLVDEVEYADITYYCNGAVCGNWWSGAFQEFPPAYAMFRFYKDGTVQREMINY